MGVGKEVKQAVAEQSASEGEEQVHKQRGIHGVNGDQQEGKVLKIDKEKAGPVAAATARAMIKPLAFMYARPIKVFRPAAVDTFFIARTRAVHYGVGVDIDNPVKRLYVILKDTVAKDGYIGLFKQIVPSIMVNSFTGFITFTVYAELIDFWKRYDRDQKLAYQHYFVAGAVGGFTQSLFSGPLDLAKLKLQLEVERTHHHLGIMHALRDEYNQFGVKALYKGFAITCARETLGMAAFFSTYDTSKRFLKPYFEDTKHGGAYAVSLSGGFAGMSYQMFNHPVEILKTEVHSLMVEKNDSYVRVRTAFKVIMEREGIMCLFRGLPYALARAFSPSAVGFLVYETIIKGLDNI
eukprot:Nk52_evm52s252 gene=Nk52_evmTU52s252